MKLTQTGFPRSAARSIVPPPTWGRTRAGAGSPTWKAPLPLDDAAADAEPDAEGPPDAEAEPEPDVDAAEAEADPEDDGDTPEGTAADGTELDGGGDTTGTGSGASTTIPPRTSAATAMPTSRPARIDRRGDMWAGGYQYERPAAASKARC